jgi:hypothetical protein
MVIMKINSYHYQYLLAIINQELNLNMVVINLDFLVEKNCSGFVEKVSKRDC